MTNSESVRDFAGRRRVPFLREYLLTCLLWALLVFLYLPMYSWWLPPLVVLTPPLAVAVASAWMPPLRRTAKVVMALEVLLAVFYVFYGRGPERIAGALYNSDMLAFPAFCQSLMHGERVSGWVFGGPNFIFPDMVPYFILNILVPNFRLSIIIFCALQLLTVLGAFALLEAEALPESRNRPLTLFVLMALLAYVAREHAYFGLHLLYEPAEHTGAILSLLFALWLIFRMVGPEAGGRSPLAYGLALFLVTLLTTMSDALFVVQFVAPALGMLGLMWLFGLIGVRKLARLGAILACGALGGGAIYRLLFMRRDLDIYFKIRPYHLPKSLGAISALLSESWRQCGWMGGVVGVLILLSVGGCVGLLIVHLRSLKRGSAGLDARMACLAGFVVFLLISNFSAILVSPAVSDWLGLFRYTIPMALLPLLMLSPLSQYALKRASEDLARPVRWSLMLAFPLLVLLSFPKLPNVARLAGYCPQWVSELDQELAKRNLKCGLAQYWQAKYFSFFSRHGVQVVQVRPPLEPFPWLCHRDWYQRPFEFIISDGAAAQRSAEYKSGHYLDPKPIIARLGPPDETFTCGKNTVLVYRNGRLRGCFQPEGPKIMSVDDMKRCLAQ